MYQSDEPINKEIPNNLTNFIMRSSIVQEKQLSDFKQNKRRTV